MAQRRAVSDAVAMMAHYRSGLSPPPTAGLSPPPPAARPLAPAAGSVFGQLSSARRSPELSGRAGADEAAMEAARAARAEKAWEGHVCRLAEVRLPAHLA